MELRIGKDIDIYIRIIYIYVYTYIRICICMYIYGCCLWFGAIIGLVGSIVNGRNVILISCICKMEIVYIHIHDLYMRVGKVGMLTSLAYFVVL